MHRPFAIASSGRLIFSPEDCVAQSYESDDEDTNDICNPNSCYAAYQEGEVLPENATSGFFVAERKVVSR